MHAPVRERGRRQEGEGDAGADDLWPEISKRILHSGLPILLLGKYSVRGLEAVSSNYRFFHSIHLKLNLFPHLNVLVRRCHIPKNQEPQIDQLLFGQSGK